MDNTAPITVTATKPESWLDETWNELESAEQYIIAGLHTLGFIFTSDIWPAIKPTLNLLFSQIGTAILNTILANIDNPKLIPSAVGTAILVTASTVGIADAKIALASAEIAVKNDPAVQSLISQTIS